MTKYITLLCMILMIIEYTDAQTLTSSKFYSESTKDSILVDVWLPKNYTERKKYPVLYEFAYNHTNYIAATLDNYFGIPDIIVVYAKMELGNSHYSSPELSENGEKNYIFLKSELIPHIDQTYSTSNYRIALGLSQGGDYVNYIMRNNPELFNAFLVFGIERPFYKVDFSTYLKRIKTNKKYFLSVANDTERRVSFANELFKNLKKNNLVEIKTITYSESEHSFVLLYGFPDALKFLFSEFNNYREMDSAETITGYYENVIDEFKKRYGTPPNINNFILELSRKITETTSEEDIYELIEKINLNPLGTDTDLWNLGKNLLKLEKYKESEKAFLYAKQKNFSDNKTLDPIMVYSSLSKVYAKLGYNQKALDVLQEGHKRMKEIDVGLLYYIGFHCINYKFKLNIGIEALEEVMTKRGKSEYSAFFSEETVALFLAIGYYKQEKFKKAKSYAEVVLTLNPENTTANDILSRIKK